MESTMVIKVKYGDTLRRFNARLNENEQLDFDMNGLRSRILGLFNFSPDADITLKYTDEDGDMVTLVEDEDLRDVMRQRLKFLRIDVQLSNEKGAKYTRSSGSSTPLRSPRPQFSLPNIDANVTEALKLVPEPLREAVSKLSVDLASKASSSNPVLAEFVDLFSKLGQSYVSPLSQSQYGADATRENGSSEIPMVPPEAVGPNAPKDARRRFLPKSSSGDSTAKFGQELGIGDLTRGVGTMAIPVPAVAPVDLNQDPPMDSNLPQYGPVEKESKYKDSHAKSDGFGASSNLAGSFRCPALKNAHAALSGSAFKECPFSGMPLESDSTVPAVAHRPIHPFKRSFTISDAMGGMFHRGVQCDGCGVHPIAGPRFKSKVKEDYDLCSICFAEMGSEGDYIRMDHSMYHRRPRLCKTLHNHTKNVVSFHKMMKSGRPRLDSRFVSDITVMDGTMMAPSTPFTKIWRMRNNGNFVWPRGTQLVWIEGAKLSDSVSVELEIPENGVPTDGQLDIAVDFIAPDSPGRYISYWRMATSSGQKFGQRVWVLIQVDALLQDSVCDGLRGLNLNMPPDCCGSKGPDTPDVNVKPVMGADLLESANYNEETDSVKPVVSEQPKEDQDLNFPINDVLLVGQSAPASAPPEAPSSVSYPIIDFSGASLPGPSSFVPYPVVESPATLTENAAVEQSLLKELEEMGFKQVDLNKEILRMNEYNLEQSVDQLCGVSEWDPMLEELEEMGFCDTEVNKRLLEKNNGSIKRVVMDLINGTKG